MKITSSQLFNATIQLLSGIYASGPVLSSDEGRTIKRAIDIVKHTAELIPDESEVMPSIEQISKACMEILKNSEMGAALLCECLSKRFKVNRAKGYVIIQSAEHEGFIVSKPGGKNKTVYSLR